MESVDLDVFDQVLEHAAAIYVAAAVIPERLAVGVGQRGVLFEPREDVPAQDRR